MGFLITVDTLGNVVELFDADSSIVPPEAVTVSDGDGVLLARSRLSAYSYINGVLGDRVSPPPTAAQMQAQIDKAEREAMLPRPVREFLILAAQKEATALGLTEPQLYAANVAYQRVKDFDTSITTLRTQKEALP